MGYGLSLLLFLMAAATSNSSAEEQTYIVHMDKAKVSALDSMLGDSRKWYEKVMDSITESSTLEEGGVEASPPKFLYSYETVTTGFAAKLSTKQLESLKKVNGFLSAVPDETLSLHTTYSPQFLGLRPEGGQRFRPQVYPDVIIGIIDTGIWPEHVSFHDRAMPPVPSRWKGACQEGINFTSSDCNRKLIGARAFFQGYESRKGKINEEVDFRSPRDSNGHGTHVASIAAGNVIPDASLSGMGKGFASGMMYTSRIAAYKVCYDLRCVTSDVLAAIDQAVSDGVDVLSISLGSTNPMPYYIDPVAIASLGAIQKGVVVAFSGGNSGPGASSVLNSAPWMITVSASTMDRSFSTSVKLGNGETFHGASLYSGKSTQQLSLVHSTDASDGLSRFCDGSTLFQELAEGKIVVCERYGDSPVEDRDAEKGEEVKSAGGAGMIVLNTDDQGEDLIADAHVLPATTVGALAANSIIEYLASENPTASISFQGTTYGYPAPAVAAFSSRGPSPIDSYVIKPDLTAPGVNILGAWPPAVSSSPIFNDNRSFTFNVLSGTSMAVPHVAGIAALLKSIHKDWSPAAIKSALMTTAYTRNNRWSQILDLAFNGTGAANAFAFGSGHVDPMRAADPGLIYDISHDDYLNYLCSLKCTPDQMTQVSRGHFTCPHDKDLQPGDLNYPSFALVFGGEVNSAIYSRTVTNVGYPRMTYVVRVEEPKGVSVKVEPSVLRFRYLNQKLSYSVSFVGEEKGSSASQVFGSLVWAAGNYTVRSPIAVTWQTD